MRLRKNSSSAGPSVPRFAAFKIWSSDAASVSFMGAGGGTRTGGSLTGNAGWAAKSKCK